MAISYRGVSNAAGQAVGSAAASTVSVTPTLPGSAAAGDRIFVYAVGTTTSGTTPAGWTVIGTKDTTLGSGAAASGSGLRRATWYYRDYDGFWTMPAFTLTSAANNSHWVAAVAITPTSGSTFNTPTITTVGGAFNTATTSYTDTSAGSFPTTSGGFLLVGTGLNDNVTASTTAVTQTGATIGTVTERADGGTATGFVVSGKVHTASVTTGASATITHTETLSAASQGETLFVEQTESVSGTLKRRVAAVADDTYYRVNSGTPSILPNAANVAAGCWIATSETDVGSQMRFTNVIIPPGATITSATITVRSDGDHTTTGANSKIRAIAADNPSTVSTTTGGFASPPFTTAAVNWDAIGSWTNLGFFSSPDISTVIQELVNRGGWASGNSVVISWDDLDHRSTQTSGNYRKGLSYDLDPASAASLDVTWTSVTNYNGSGTQTTTATITGASSATGSGTRSTTATITGAGGGTGSGTRTTTATISGSGGGAGSGSVSATASITGAGGASSSGTVSTTASITGSGVVAISGAATSSTAATISGAGAVTSSGSGSPVNVGASITGSGGTSGSGSVSTAASITGAGVVGLFKTATALTVTAAVAGTGAGTGSGSRSNTATITGTGVTTLSTGGTSSTTAAITGNGAANVVGSGSLTVTAAIQASATGAVNGSGTRSVTATIAGAGVVARVGSGTESVTATITGAGITTGSGTRSTTATITGNGVVAGTGSGSLTTTASITGSGSGAVPGSGSVAVTATITGSGSAAGAGVRSANAAITGSGVVGVVGTGSITVLAVISATVSADTFGSGSLTGVAVIGGDGVTVPLFGPPPPERIVTASFDSRLVIAVHESRSVSAVVNARTATAVIESRTAVIQDRTATAVVQPRTVTAVVNDRLVTA